MDGFPYIGHPLGRRWPKELLQRLVRKAASELGWRNERGTKPEGSTWDRVSLSPGPSTQGFLSEQQVNAQSW